MRPLWTRAIIVAALLVCTTAMASRPYLDFRLELDRADTDAARMDAAIDAEPLLAQLWFYANVFDLATEGISAAEKTRIRARATAIADRLVHSGITSPRIALDGEGDEHLAALAATVRQGIDLASRPRIAGDGRALPLSATSSIAVRGVFYGLLNRAFVSRNAMGGQTRVADLLDAARTLAGAWYHLTADDTLWRSLAAYQGGAVRLDDMPVAAQAEARGLIALLGGDAAAATSAFRSALSVERSQNGSTPRATFLRGALAEAMRASGDTAGALRARQSMLREFAAVDTVWVPARGRARVIEILTGIGDHPTLLAEIETILNVGPIATGDPEIAPILLAAADALRKAGEDVLATDAERAETLLAGASALYRTLQSPAVLAPSVPAASRESEARSRAAAASAVDVARARLADARGRIAEAHQMALDARPALGPADGATTDAFLGRLALDLGLLDAALERTGAAEAALVDPTAKAQNRLVRARTRLARTEDASAFAWANAALRGLRAAELSDRTRPLRAELHRIAASALYAAGFEEAARNRLVFALGVHPSTAAALDLAGLRWAAGDRDGALAATRIAAGPETIVAAGCIQTVSDPQSALTALDTARTGDPTIAFRRDVCRAIAQVRSRRAAVARAMLDGLNDFTGAHADPATTAGLDAVVSVVASDAEVREKARRRALEDRRRALADGRPAVSRHRPSPPLALGNVTAELAVDDATSLRHALGGSDLLSRGWRPAPAGPSTDAVRAAIAHVAGRISAFRRAQGDDVAHAREALGEARRALDAALGAQSEAHPRWSALVRPGPPAADELVEAGAHQLIYRVGFEASRVWYLAPGEADARSFPLPGERALAERAAQVSTALKDPQPWPSAGDADPHDATWAALEDAAQVLLPAEVRKALDDRPIYIRADGPLTDFVFDALVIARPPHAGAAPRFLATDRAIYLRGTARPSKAPTPARGSYSAADLAPADIEAMRSTLGAAYDSLETRTPDQPATGRAVQTGSALADAAFTGGSLGLLITDVPPPMPMVRWSGISEVLVPSGLGADPAAAAELWSHLLARPTQPALVFTPGADGGGALMPGRIADVAEPVEPGAAVRRFRLDAMTAPAIPGLIPTHHPSHWARWRRVLP